MRGRKLVKSWPEEWPDVTFTRRKKQRYLRLRVYPDRIAVSGPTYCSIKEMEHFVHVQKDHISKSLIRLRMREEKIEAIVKDHENQMLLRGVWKDLQPAVISADKSKKNRMGNWHFTEQNDIVLFHSPPNLNTYPGKDVKLAFYRSLADSEVRNRFYRLAQSLPFKYNRVFIRSQTTRWGTCSSKGNVSFNWRLIKCPHWIWDYLFVHELCHTVHMNHSAEFWQLVNVHYPRLEEARAWIREHESLIFSDI